MSDVPIAVKISEKASSVSLDKTDKEFALKLYKDSNVVTSKTQIYSFLYNTTYFKYGTIMIGKC